MAAPGSQMHFVDRDRRAERIDTGGGGLGPWNGVEIDYNRGSAWPQLRREGHGIRLERQHLAVRRDDLVFVVIADFGLRHKDLPEPVAAHPHGMAAAVPGIEIADHAHTLGI